MKGAALDDAIAAATRFVRAAQEADGGWDCPCDAGPASTAQALIALASIDHLDPTLARAALAGVVDTQRSDGGFPAWPGAATSDPGVTASVLAALSLPSAEAFAASRERAAGYLASAGGPRAAVAALARGDFGALFAVWADVFPAEVLPAVPLGALLVDPLRTALSRRVLPVLPLLIAQLGAIRGHRMERGPRAEGRSSLDAAIRRQIVALHAEIQNPEGGFVNLVPHTALAVLALRAIGQPPDHEMLLRAGAFLRGQIARRADGTPFFPVFRSSLWTTSLSVRALVRAGVRGDDPGLCAAVSWLLAAQSTSPQARGNQPDRHAIRVGGFGFQQRNPRMPDCDDTAVALDALTVCAEAEGLPPSLRREIHGAIVRAIVFLVAMRNEDGGFSAFVRGLPGKPPGPILTRPAALPLDLPGLVAFLRAPLYAMGDPSTEDVTARVLRALAPHGLAAGHPASDDAIAFLRRMQREDGSFWGRWSTNYLWATAHAVLGLRAAGIGPDDPRLRAAQAFLASKQNEDGGFGETIESYADPTRAGEGPSMPDLTALVLEAFVALGHAKTTATTRAAGYLVATQTPAGDWPDGGHLQVIVPPDSFYLYTASLGFQPLEALAAYRSALADRVDE